MSVMPLGTAAKGGRATAMTSPPSLAENLQGALCVFVQWFFSKLATGVFKVKALTSSA